MITTVATQHVVKEKEKELVELMTTLTTQVKANEPGCALYLFVKSIDTPQTYLVVEQYKDQDAYDLHYQTSYLKDFMPKMMACLEQAPAFIHCNDIFN